MEVSSRKKKRFEECATNTVSHAPRGEERTAAVATGTHDYKRSILPHCGIFLKTLEPSNPRPQEPQFPFKKKPSPKAVPGAIRNHPSVRMSSSSRGRKIDTHLNLTSPGVHLPQPSCPNGSPRGGRVYLCECGEMTMINQLFARVSSFELETCGYSTATP